MADKHWKRFERMVAAFLGLRRVPLSGGASGHDTRADLMRKKGEEHMPLRLFFELKHLAKSALHTLMARTRIIAKQEGRVPVLVIGKRGERGAIIAFHTDDFDIVTKDLVSLRQAAIIGEGE